MVYKEEFNWKPDVSDVICTVNHLSTFLYRHLFLFIVKLIIMKIFSLKISSFFSDDIIFWECEGSAAGQVVNQKRSNLDSERLNDILFLLSICHVLCTWYILSSLMFIRYYSHSSHLLLLLFDSFLFLFHSYYSSSIPFRSSSIPMAPLPFFAVLSEIECDGMDMYTRGGGGRGIYIVFVLCVCVCVFFSFLQ